MWPFVSRTKYIERVASLLDAVFSNALSRLNTWGVDMFRAWLVSSQFASVADAGPAEHDTLSWRDHRMPEFQFWVDLKANPWSIHAMCDNGLSSPSFVGTLLTAGPSGAKDGGVSKAVSVEDGVRSKATPAAKQLGQLLSEKYNYMDLSEPFVAVSKKYC